MPSKLSTAFNMLKCWYSLLLAALYIARLWSFHQSFALSSIWNFLVDWVGWTFGTLKCSHSNMFCFSRDAFSSPLSASCRLTLEVYASRVSMDLNRKIRNSSYIQRIGRGIKRKANRINQQENLINSKPKQPFFTTSIACNHPFPRHLWL